MKNTTTDYESSEKMVRCLICNRQLKDAVSIKRHIGPTCMARLNKVKQMYKPKRVEKIKGQISLFEVIKDEKADS